MNIKSLVTNWESLHNANRSLINFFMKHAKIYLHGVYDNGIYTALSCNVQYRYKVYCYDTTWESTPQDTECYLLNLPLTTYSNSQGSETYPAAVSDSLPLITSPLLRKSSKLHFCRYYKSGGGGGSGGSGGGSGSGGSGDQSGTYNVESLYDITGSSVDLIPTVSNVENIDDSLKPSDISSASDTISVDVAPLGGMTLNCDYQLRTSTFKLGSDEVYYKIGIFPFIDDIDVTDPTLSVSVNTIDSRLSDIIDYLKTCTFNVLRDSDDYTRLAFDDGYTYREFIVETSLGDRTISKAIPGGIILPIFNDYDIVAGLAYLQLFSGTTESAITYSNNPSLSVSDDGTTWTSITGYDNMCTAITDEHMDDGEFVPYSL